MPQIKNVANLDFGADSIFRASKKVSQVALRNLELNRQNDPNTPQRVIKSPDEVNADFNTFLGDVTNLKLLIDQTNAYIEQGLKIYAEEQFPDDIYGRNTFVRHTTKNPNFLGKYEPKTLGHEVGSGRPRTKRIAPNLFDSISNPSPLVGYSDIPRYSKKVIQQKPHLNFQARAESSESESSSDEEEGGVIDHLSRLQMAFNSSKRPKVLKGGADNERVATAGGSPSRRSAAVHPIEWGVPGGESDDSEEEDEESELEEDIESVVRAPISIEHKTSKDIPVLNLLAKIATDINRLDIFFNGKIKKNINLLNPVKIQELTIQIDDLIHSFNRISVYYITTVLQNSLMYNNMVDRLKKLEMSVLIAIKSYSQTKQGGIVPRAPILSHSSNYKNCPTKYLL